MLWDGGAGTSLWSDAANWQPDGLPGPTDDVIIDVPRSPLTIAHPSGSTTIKSLLLEEHLNLSGGSLNLAEPSVVNGTLTLGGTLTGNGDLTVNGALAWLGNDPTRAIAHDASNQLVSSFRKCDVIARAAHKVF